MFFITIFASPCPKVATKCAKPGCSDRGELDVDMVDQAEATPGSQVRFLPLPGVRGETCIRQVHVPQVHGGRGRHLPRPFAARVTNGATLVMYLKGAPCALGGGGRHGRPRGHRPRGGEIDPKTRRAIF